MFGEEGWKIPLTTVLFLTPYKETQTLYEE